MRRVFGLAIVICAFASACASVALAQSGRARRAEQPKEERTEKTEKFEAREEARDESTDESKDKARVDGGAAQADGGEQVLTGRDVTVRAVIKSRPLPGYPRFARPFGVQGQVKLRIILGSDGRVRDEMEVLEGLPYGVTEEAIKAARKIEFEPARKNGRPVSQYVTVIYNFNLH